MNHQKETINNNNFHLEFSLLKQRRKERQSPPPLFSLHLYVRLGERSRSNVCQVAAELERQRQGCRSNAPSLIITALP